MGALAKALRWMTDWDPEPQPVNTVTTLNPVGDYSAKVLPPARTVSATTPREAAGMSAVFRAFQILSTSTIQLSIDAIRNNQLIGRPAMLSQPDVTMSGAKFYALCVTTLAGWGNVYLEHVTNERGVVTSVKYLNPSTTRLGRNPGTGALELHVGARRVLKLGEFTHIGYLWLGDGDEALGPIQAAQAELKGAAELTEYSSAYFQVSGDPSGILSTDQHITQAQADEALAIWESVPAGHVRITGSGLHYDKNLIDPAAAQFLENRRFTKTELADLFGIPGSLYLGADQGTSKTYANVEQDWIGFVRFGLMSYLRPIELALSDLLPRGQEARFNIDALLRTDTKTRYEAYAIGIDKGFLGVDEVRALEHLPPKAPAAPAAAPTQPAPVRTA